MWRDFKAFLLRGNVVDLAVAIVIGVVFAALVSQFVSSFITPLIAVLFGETSFADLAFEVNGARFTYGRFIDALLRFLFTAAAVYFFVVRPMNAFVARRRGAEAPATRPCPECASEISVEARRCPHCTSTVTVA